MNVIETIRLSLVFEKYGFFKDRKKETPEHEILSEIYQALSPEVKERLKEKHEFYKKLPPEVMNRYIKKEEPAVAPTTTSSGEKNIYLNKDNTTDAAKSQAVEKNSGEKTMNKIYLTKREFCKNALANLIRSALQERVAVEYYITIDNDEFVQVIDSTGAVLCDVDVSCDHELIGLAAHVLAEI